MLRQRALSAAILVPPLLIVLVLGGPWIVALIVVATALAAIEVFRLLGAAGYPSVAVLGIALAVGVVLDGAVASALDGSGLILIAVGTILAAVGAFAKQDPREGLPTWFATVFGAIYASMLGFVVRLGNAAPEPPASAPLAFLGGERGWILLLVLGVWAYDTGAYFVGKRFGRAKFLAHISPSKTYGGLTGGLGAGTVVVTIIAVLLGEPPFVGIALGPLLGLSAQAGDLAESMLKRGARAKGSRALIPGHGGILDGVASFLFAAPVAALYVLAVVR